MGHGVATTAALGLACLLGAAAVATASWIAAAWVGVALATYWASMVLLMLLLEWCVRRILRERGETIAGFGAWGWFCTAMSVPLAQIVHFAALAAALTTRNHQWRGVRYQFYGLSPVRVLEDLAETN